MMYLIEVLPASRTTFTGSMRSSKPRTRILDVNRRFGVGPSRVYLVDVWTFWLSDLAPNLWNCRAPRIKGTTQHVKQRPKRPRMYGSSNNRLNRIISCEAC